MSRWLSNKDSVLQAKRITFQVILKPHDPLFPWAAGLPWGAFPKMVKELLVWAHAQGMLTEHGLNLDGAGGAVIPALKAVATDVAEVDMAMPETLAGCGESERASSADAPFVIRRYRSP